MKQEENERYEQWLQQVRKTQPILTRPDDLTRDILQKVARTPRKRKERRKFMTWASAIAAGFFFALLSTRMVGKLHCRNDNKRKGRPTVRNVESTEG